MQPFTEAQTASYKSALVRFYEEDKVIGAGLYFRNGYVLTCAHVVAQGLGLGKNPQAVVAESVVGKPIKLDFPFPAGQQFQTAKVVPTLWCLNGEDLAILRIESSPEGSSPLRLSKSTYYRGHQCHIFGFPKGHPDGVWAQGKFLDEQVRGRVQIEDTKTQGFAIEPGFSGAPIWDEELEGIAGIAVTRDKDREEAKVGFMIPYQKLKPALEAIELFELFPTQVENLDRHWQSAYQLVKPENFREPYPTTLESAILQVQDMTGQDSKYRAIDLFIGYLCLPEPGLSIRPRLVEWLQNHKVDVTTLLKHLQQKVADQESKPPVGLASHLLVWVKSAWNSDRYSVQTYLIPNLDHYDPNSSTGLKKFLESETVSNQLQLEEFLQECIDESINELPHQEGEFPPLQLEVFLPRQCLQWPVDQWRIGKKMPSNPKPKAISSRYRVVLRCADRLDRKHCTNQMLILWKQKWNTLSLEAKRVATQCLTCGNHKDGDSLSDDLEPNQIMGWHRLEPPPSVLEDEACHFSVLLGTGTFAAIWLRQTSDNSEEELSQLLNSCLIELPSKVSDLRKSASVRPDKTSPHIGEQISLIWDDPKLVPPIESATSRLRMPA